jgi:sugar/nucleoside kinase (ribokinase family)
MKIVFVGHVCVDKNVVRGETETIGGGGVFHGGITAQRLGAEAVVVTKCAESDRPSFHRMSKAGVRVIFLSTPTSTSIRNVYPSENPDERQSLLISRAAPFAEGDLEQIAAQKADVVHVNPLWLGEFPPPLLAALRPSVAMLCADAQGFLRVAESDGRMVHRDLAQKREVLPLLDLLKVDAKEALVLTGQENPQRAARAVHALGPRMVLLTHRDGVCVFDGGTLHESAFSGFTLEGRTGRGDTCTASFLVARGRGMDLAEATAFAAEVTSRKMQYRGPYRG